MILPNLGYACINNELAEQAIQVNRSMMKKTFVAKGIGFASSLALKNVSDLAKLIDWNVAHDIMLYRMSSDMFPWMSEYEFENLPDISAIEDILKSIGETVKRHGVRLTFHPGPFNVLASPNENVVVKTVKELRQHGEIMDMLTLPQTPFAKINIHIGGVYGDKQAATARFISNFKQLPATAAKRLTIENDDKASMFSVGDLLTVYEATGAPLVFDYLHHQFCSGDLTEREAFELAVSTWPSKIKPIVHFSSSKRSFEDPAAHEAAHADFLYSPVNTYGTNVDIMMEAKGKEQAILKYREDFMMAAQ